MMNVPTDNLYKFMAIAGFALVLSALVFWWNASKEIDGISAELGGQVEEFRALYTGYAHKANRLLAIRNDAKGEPGKNEKEKLVKGLNAMEPKTNELDIMLARNYKTASLLRYRLQNHGIVKWGVLISVVLGLIVSGLGFYLWFTRLQVKLDRKLDSEQ